MSFYLLSARFEMPDTHRMNSNMPGVKRQTLSEGLTGPLCRSTQHGGVFCFLARSHWNVGHPELKAGG
jgi:hypothetical protein